MIALMLAHIQTRPVPPSVRAPARRIAPELDAVVMRALAKRPEDRFADAPAMASALSNAIGYVPPGEESTRRVAVVGADTVMTAPQPALPVASAWPPTAGPSDQNAPSLAMSRRPARRWDRVLPAVLLLLLLLGGVVGGAALFLGLGDGDDEPGELVANLDLTPTAEEQVIETPTEPPAPTATEPPPTQTPVPTPTEPPPTQTPVPTPTAPPPTQTPVPTETPLPPPTETPEPVPTDPPIESVETNPSAADQTDGSDGEGAPGTMTLDIAASDWRGAYFQETGNLRPWSAVYAQSTGYGEGTLRFTVDGEPASDTFNLTVDGMTSENWTELPISISVNGQRVYTGDSPFPTWNGVDGQQPWGTASIDLPVSVLQPGENTLTFTNRVVEGEFSRPPYILLAGGTLTIEMRDPAGVLPPSGVMVTLAPARRSRRLRARRPPDHPSPRWASSTARVKGRMRH